MRVRMGLTALAVLVVSSGALGGFGVALEGTGGESEIRVPPGGGTYDVAVWLTRTADETRAVSGAQFRLTAGTSAEVSSALRGVIGAPDLSGTGTRYNGNEWDTDTTGGMALDPNLAAGPLSTTPSAPLGSQYKGLWTSSTSLLGYLSITVGSVPPGERAVITPVSVLLFPDFVHSIDDISGTGTAVTFTPEPTCGVAALLGLIFLRVRSRGDPRRASRQPLVGRPFRPRQLAQYGSGGAPRYSGSAERE